MKSKRLIIFLIVLVLIRGLGAYSKSSMCVIKQSAGSNDEWTLNTSSVVPFWICLNLIRNDILSRSRNVLIFVEPENFTLENLKAIFLHLSAEFNEPEILSITARSDRKKLQRLASIYRRLSSNKLQDQTKRRAAEVELAEAFGSAGIGCYRADYIRLDRNERFYYYPDPNKKDGFAVVLKSSPSKFKPTGNAVSDLMHASKFGLTKYVRMFLDQGVDVNVKDKDGRTALMTAAMWRQIEVVRVLLDGGADLNIKGPNGWTALMYALQMSRLNETEIAEELLSRGTDVNARSDDGETVLMLATKQGHTKIVEELLNRGADVNAKDAHGRTALMIAEENGPKGIVLLLKQAGAKQ